MCSVYHKLNAIFLLPAPYGVQGKGEKLKRKDLTGRRFGKLVVIKDNGIHITPSGKKKFLWLCQCDCGNRKVVTGKRLVEGRTKSCGCIRHYGIFNDFLEEDNTIRIFVGNSEVLIDKEDFDKIYPDRVYIDNGYAKCRKHDRIHRVVMNCPDEYMVDHINHNTLDNRKCNLRIVTNSENQLNRVIRSNTGEFGICRNKYGTYDITINGSRIGARKTLSEAVSIRNKALVGTRQLELNYFLSGKAENAE